MIHYFPAHLRFIAFVHFIQSIASVNLKWSEDSISRPCRMRLTTPTLTHKHTHKQNTHAKERHFGDAIKVTITTIKTTVGSQ